MPERLYHASTLYTISFFLSPAQASAFRNRHAINALSFSHDGEYIAIANAGLYIDIVRFHISLNALSLLEAAYLSRSVQQKRVFQYIVYQLSRHRRLLLGTLPSMLLHTVGRRR